MMVRLVLTLWLFARVHAGSQNVYLDPSGNAHQLAMNQTNPFRLYTEEQLKQQRSEKRKRMRERRERARRLLQSRPPPEQLEQVSDEELQRMRKLGWFSGSAETAAYSSSVLVDPSQEYDKWAQAYRMLGGFIDCDHDKDGSGSGDQNGGGGACSRWMMWAAYINPNYQGNEYYEYFGDEPTSYLDCHSPDTEWQLLGVYRQEFYQFIEQISKHLWAIDDYEYVVARAGMSYMTDEDCFYVGTASSGTSIYAGVAPQQYGKFQMALYTDTYCITPDTSLGMTYDDFGMTSDVDLGSKDENDDSSWAYDWWYDAQEYTLSNLNDVYEEYKYCTSCVDYPTYQDGYFIGDDGTDDDDLINQCWKFYSHDSFTCEADCIAKAHAQGTILSIKYGDTTFGKTISGFYQEREAGSGSSAATESPFQRLMANAALTASFLLFVATFLAFAVARRSRYRESRGSRSRRLLDDDEEGRSRRSRRSKSSRTTEDGDGLFRASGRSKSSGRKSSSRSKSHRSSSKGDRSKKQRRSRSYDPPKEAVSSRSKSAARAEEYF